MLRETLQTLSEKNPNKNMLSLELPVCPHAENNLGKDFYAESGSTRAMRTVIMGGGTTKQIPQRRLRPPNLINKCCMAAICGMVNPGPSCMPTLGGSGTPCPAPSQHSPATDRLFHPAGPSLCPACPPPAKRPQGHLAASRGLRCPTPQRQADTAREVPQGTPHWRRLMPWGDRRCDRLCDRRCDRRCARRCDRRCDDPGSIPARAPPSPLGVRPRPAAISRRSRPAAGGPRHPTRPPPPPRRVPRGAPPPLAGPNPSPGCSKWPREKGGGGAAITGKAPARLPGPLSSPSRARRPHAQQRGGAAGAGRLPQVGGAGRDAGAGGAAAGVAALVVLEGGDGAHPGGAAVLGQDHLRQRHRGEGAEGGPEGSPEGGSEGGSEGARPRFRGSPRRLSADFASSRPLLHGFGARARGWVWEASPTERCHRRAVKGRLLGGAMRAGLVLRRARHRPCTAPLQSGRWWLRLQAQADLLQPLP